MQEEYTAPPVGVVQPETARPFLIAEFGHFCFRCGAQPDEDRPKMDVDHIIPVARGGGNFYGNYELLCGPCNSWKGTRIYDFRPGDHREIEAGLPIIPADERVRRPPIKVVPYSGELPKIEVPVTLLHNCKTDTPNLIDELVAIGADNRALAEAKGALTEQLKAEEERHRKSEEQVRKTQDENKTLKKDLEFEREAGTRADRCASAFMIIIIALGLLLLTSVGFAVSPYIH